MVYTFLICEHTRHHSQDIHPIQLLRTRHSATHLQVNSSNLCRYPVQILRRPVRDEHVAGLVGEHQALDLVAGGFDDELGGDAACLGQSRVSLIKAQRTKNECLSIFMTSYPENRHLPLLEPLRLTKIRPGDIPHPNLPSPLPPPGNGLTVRRKKWPGHVAHLFHILRTVGPHGHDAFRVREDARGEHGDGRAVHGDDGVGGLVSGPQACCGEHLLERERASDQEPDVVGGPEVLDISLVCSDAFPFLVDAVAREIRADVEVARLDASCWQHGVRIPARRDA